MVAQSPGREGYKMKRTLYLLHNIESDFLEGIDPEDIVWGYQDMVAGYMAQATKSGWTFTDNPKAYYCAGLGVVKYTVSAEHQGPG